LTVVLARRGVTLDAPVIIARTGWTTRDVMDGVQSAHPQGPYALVTVQIGVNDQYRGGDPEHFRSDLRLLLAQAIHLAGGHSSRVIAVSIPDWGVTPFAMGRNAARISSAIDSFNAVLREETALAGVAFVSVTDSSRASGRDAAFLVSDGLHPSSTQYAQWVALIAPVAEAALAPR
jgi:lysophospholipase L1-like esterase